MRRIALIALAALVLQGCYVFDELNKGEKEMDRYSGMSPHAHVEQQAAPQPEAPAKKDAPSLLARAKAWWAEKREPKPPQRDPDDKITRCEVGGSTQYMYTSDCRARAGHVL